MTNPMVIYFAINFHETQFSTVKTPSKEKETDDNVFTNAARKSKKLLGIVSEVKKVTSAVVKFKSHHKQSLPEKVQK